MFVEYKNNREKEFKRIDNIKNGWKISLKYATILNDNIANDNISDTIYSIYGKFIRELKSNKLNKENKMKYMRCWKTLMDTNYKYKSLKNIKIAIKQLHYTSYINYTN